MRAHRAGIFVTVRLSHRERTPLSTDTSHTPHARLDNNDNNLWPINNKRIRSYPIFSLLFICCVSRFLSFVRFRFRFVAFVYNICTYINSYLFYAHRLYTNGRFWRQHMHFGCESVKNLRQISSITFLCRFYFFFFFLHLMTSTVGMVTSCSLYSSLDTSIYYCYFSRAIFWTRTFTNAVAEPLKSYCFHIWCCQCRVVVDTCHAQKCRLDALETSPRFTFLFSNFSTTRNTVVKFPRSARSRINIYACARVNTDGVGKNVYISSHLNRFRLVVCIDEPTYTRIPGVVNSFYIFIYDVRVRVE